MLNRKLIDYTHRCIYKHAFINTLLDYDKHNSELTFSRPETKLCKSVSLFISEVTRTVVPIGTSISGIYKKNPHEELF